MHHTSFILEISFPADMTRVKLVSIWHCYCSPPLFGFWRKQDISAHALKGSKPIFVPVSFSRSYDQDIIQLQCFEQHRSGLDPDNLISYQKIWQKKKRKKKQRSRAGNVRRGADLIKDVSYPKPSGSAGQLLSSDQGRVSAALISFGMCLGTSQPRIQHPVRLVLGSEIRDGVKLRA